MRGKNKKEKLGGFIKGFAKGVDEVLLSSQKVMIYTANVVASLYCNYNA